MIIKENQIKKFVNLIFLKMGLNKKDSALVSEQLINSDMSGHYSHGINRIFQYQNGVKKKIMAINKKPKITKRQNVPKRTVVAGKKAAITFPSLSSWAPLSTLSCTPAGKSEATI